MGSRQGLVLLGLFGVLVACSNERATQDMSLPDSAAGIVNGAAVSSSEASSKQVVLILNRLTGDICSGAILNNQFVLTAAHCIDASENLALYFGTGFVTNGKFNPGNGPSRPVVEAQTPKFWQAGSNQSQNTGDIALIKFAGGLPPGFSPVSLLPDADVLKNGQNAMLVGYGVSSPQDGTGAGILRRGHVSISKLDFSATEIALDQTQQNGACGGDSGGPAFVVVNNQTLLMGIISRSLNDPKNTCAQSVIATSVPMYTGWITETMNSMNAGDANDL